MYQVRTCVLNRHTHTDTHTHIEIVILRNIFHNTLKLRAFVVKMCITFVHLYGTIRTLLHVMVNSLRSLLAQCTAGSRNRFEDAAMKKNARNCSFSCTSFSALACVAPVCASGDIARAVIAVGSCLLLQQPIACFQVIHRRVFPCCCQRCTGYQNHAFAKAMNLVLFEDAMMHLPIAKFE